MVYITGDTHGGLDGDKLFHLKRAAGAGDYVIVAGDFGYIWETNPANAEELKRLRKLSALPYTLLFIDGNHENFQRLFSGEFPEEDRFGGRVKKIRENIYYLLRGGVYTIDSFRFLCAGGALSTDKAYRTEGVSWWPEEIPDAGEQRAILKQLDKSGRFDWVITHAAPQTVVRRLEADGLLLSKTRLEDPVSVFLEQIFRKAEFKRWYCGHYHMDKIYTINGKTVQLLYNSVTAAGEE